MTIEEARTKLAGIVQASASPALTDEDLNAALEVSVIPDPSGTRPGKPGWIETYDLMWAAAQTCATRAAKALIAQAITGDQITEITSEGTRIVVSPSGVSWTQVAEYFRSRSVIGRYLGKDFGVIEVDTGSGYTPRSAEFTTNRRGEQWI